jgi:tol-pal system protein YbgF
LRNSIYLLLLVLVFFVSGCASTQDLKATRLEMEEKLAAVNAELATVKKNSTTLDSMRKGQANAVAEITDLRDNIQQLRGQVEALKKDLAVNTKKEEQAFDTIFLKINFIENFLEIGKKDTLSDTPNKNSKSTGNSVAKDPAKKQNKEKAYSAAYQTFKEGNYDKAMAEFQKFLTDYPDSEYSDNAQFWIGECYFFKKNYEQAILEYEKVVKNYSSGNKVPYALLKQGLSFLNLGDKTSAKLLLQQVIKDYPNTNQARIARSKLQEIK